MRQRSAWMIALLLAGPLTAQAAKPPPPRKDPAPKEAAKEPQPIEVRAGKDDSVAGAIITKPIRDVGLIKTHIPPVLTEAAEAPYSLTGLRTCQQISAAVRQLSAALGPDYDAPPAPSDNRAEKLAEAGGKAVVGSFIPFGSVVREVSGAATAERRLAAAITAGSARRGFLRGVHLTRKCKTPF